MTLRHRLRALLGLVFFCLPGAGFAPALAAEPAKRMVLQLWPEGVPGLREDAAPEKVENQRVTEVHFPTLTIYEPAAGAVRTGTGVVVCPGGGYVRLAAGHEGEDIACWLNARGVTAFVLHYRMVEYGHPAPLQDVLRAIRTVRARAQEWSVQPDRVGVIGFSAGGHLACSAATMWDAPEGRTGAELDAVSARPDFAILIYPVVTMRDPYTHAGSRRALLGEGAAAEMINRMSLETRVTAQMPPVFLVHALDDKSVPVENSLGLLAALRAAGVPVEMHLYEEGGHGFGMRPQTEAGRGWPAACDAWLQFHGWLAAERAAE